MDQKSREGYWLVLIRKGLLNLWASRGLHYGQGAGWYWPGQERAIIGQERAGIGYGGLVFEPGLNKDNTYFLLILPLSFCRDPVGQHALGTRQST